MSVELAEPYRPRAVVALGIWCWRDWRLKRYGIAYGGDKPDDELVAAAEEAATRALPDPALTVDRYGVGFLGIHEGRGGNFVFVDWWEQENELHHHVFFSTPEEPALLRAAGADDPIACAWDLAVIAHERSAWVQHVLAADVPDADAYLADTLSGVV